METLDILQTIIQPQLVEHFVDWEKFANEKERKGLKLIASIYKHKGLKKFRADPPSKQLESFQKSNTIDYKKAEELYRKGQVTSMYSSEYGGAVKESKPQTNIFRYQKCSETEFKLVLTKLAVQFLDNWIELQDEAEFQDLVLICLRSLNARYKSIQVGKSETKAQYNWNVDWKLCKPIRIDKIGGSENASKGSSGCALVCKQQKRACYKMAMAAPTCFLQLNPSAKQEGVQMAALGANQMWGTPLFERKGLMCSQMSTSHVLQKVVMTSDFEKTNPYVEELKKTAAYITQPGKGILASDESNATTGKRLATVGLDNTEANRQAWRELLYSAPGLGNYISGTIMFDETLFQSSRAGEQFVDILKKQGIVPGIKVDTGLQPIDGTDGETSTQGLDGLADRCKRYYQQGARFAKWRAVLKVDADKCPSSTAILENAHGLARYAQIAQANGLVPIVEPEVTLGPGDYTIERTAYISEKVNSHVFRLLNEYNVILEGILLKPNMILPGLDVPTPSPEEVARYTVRTMLRSIPPAVPGIHFLSGGMSEEEATLNLQALQAYGPTPWSLTFSYGRALQSSTLKIWSGKEESWKAAQERLVALAKANSEAQLGKYQGPHPSPGGARILQALRLGGAGK